MCKNKKDQMFCKEMNKIHKKLNMKRLQQLTCKIDHIYLQLISYTKAIEYHCSFKQISNDRFYLYIIIV